MLHKRDPRPEPEEGDREELIENLRQYQFELQQQNEELRRTHWELTRAKERFRKLWDDAPVGYVSHDRTGTIRSANKRAKLLLGNIAPLREGSTLQEFLNHRSQLVLRQHLWSVAAAKTNINVELQLETAGDQPDIWIRVESTAAPSGEFHSALIDISAQKAAEAERQAMASQLRHSQKMEILHELSAGIAHDFNNILQVVIAYAEFVRGELLRDGKDVAHVDSLLEGAGRGVDLTRRLLAFSRKSSLQTNSTDLREVIENAVAFARRTIGDHIQVSSDSTSKPLPVSVDSNLIEQATLNLCLNARDAMPKGGQLCVNVDVQTLLQAETINGCQVAAGDYAVITVADDGIGMSEETLQKVFEPFFTTKGVASGTGLGLSIVYGIIRQHHGAISVESCPDQGSAFTVLLPLSASPPTTRESLLNGTNHNVNAIGKILFAEDEPAIREIVSATLRQAGYDVTVATDGQHALQILEQNADEFDLLLTDAVMPNASGKEVCEAFRSVRQSAPVVFLTGHWDSVVDPDFLTKNDASLLTKPIRVHVLLAEIEERLRLSREPRASSLP